MNGQAGKGDVPRPIQNQAAYNRNWDLAFRGLGKPGYKSAAQRHIELRKLMAGRLQAIKNRSRQRLREEAGKDVRVPSSLWDQVIRDFNRQIYATVSTAAKRLRT